MQLSPPLPASAAAATPNYSPAVAVVPQGYGGGRSTVATAQLVWIHPCLVITRRITLESSSRPLNRQHLPILQAGVPFVRFDVTGERERGWKQLFFDNGLPLLLLRRLPPPPPPPSTILCGNVADTVVDAQNARPSFRPPPLSSMVSSAISVLPKLFFWAPFLPAPLLSWPCHSYRTVTPCHHRPSHLDAFCEWL